jgi:hypothetical protein
MQRQEREEDRYDGGVVRLGRELKRKREWAGQRG